MSAEKQFLPQTDVFRDWDNNHSYAHLVTYRKGLIFLQTDAFRLNFPEKHSRLHGNRHQLEHARFMRCALIAFFQDADSYLYQNL